MSWSLQIELVVFSQHRELKPFRSQTYNSLNHVPYFYYNFSSENFEFHQTIYPGYFFHFLVALYRENVSVL